MTRIGRRRAPHLAMRLGQAILPDTHTTYLICGFEL